MRLSWGRLDPRGQVDPVEHLKVVRLLASMRGFRKTTCDSLKAVAVSVTCMTEGSLFVSKSKRPFSDDSIHLCRKKQRGWNDYDL
ncbi:hypothetical protein TNIN_388571 [Trichonephila inaurata madagascariensis]|uniref:Uncharacterized protein n=1 Tax=Trichonephila inaurata madagascariensis TaxID=2747483 RepID=A0A8X6MA12_9ARAC|nr:hypothetical protein TNIN_388571 [Trichonephila inaurata madagascariensis]